jgi:hypothetical protein
MVTYIIFKVIRFTDSFGFDLSFKGPGNILRSIPSASISASRDQAIS